ncbi:hypothetical protein D1007_36116 [Hordeum vulgare]|nr:hypothetical protein D1007_36116 [Hordeum vulgare]
MTASQVIRPACSSPLRPALRAPRCSAPPRPACSSPLRPDRLLVAPPSSPFFYLFFPPHPVPRPARPLSPGYSHCGCHSIPVVEQGGTPEASTFTVTYTTETGERIVDGGGESSVALQRRIPEPATPTDAAPAEGARLCTPPTHDNTLDATADLDAPRRYRRIEDVYGATNAVYIPVNIKNCHWYLAVVNAKICEIQVLDSFGPYVLHSDDLTLIGLTKHLDIASKSTDFIMGNKWHNLDVAS